MRERLRDYLIDCNIGFLESAKDIGKCRERILFEIFVGLDREVGVICFFDARRSDHCMVSREFYIFFFISYDNLRIRVDRGNRLADGWEEGLVGDEIEIDLAIFINNLIGDLYMVENGIEDGIFEGCGADLPE